MASRLKEEEKNEKAIRSLLKQASNRRCINCNSLGPQYVCLNFCTFVCTQCSGIHREFTHRIKSVSMSKFTSQEVANLERGGNERAREIYFKDWDPVRKPLPDSSNIDRLRDFIRMVYVEKRLCAEKVQARGGEKDDGYDKRSASQASQKGLSRSPPYEERNRNDRHDHVRHQNDEQVVNRNRNDHYHEEKHFSNGRVQHDENGRRHAGRFQNERESWKYGGSPPPVRSVKEILGEDVPPLRIENNKGQTNGVPEKDNTLYTSQDGHVRRVGSSSSFGSGDDTSSVPPVVKREEPISLIDLTDPEPLPIKEQPDAASNNTGWASFDMAPSSTAPALASLLPTLTPAATTAQNMPLADPSLQATENADWAAQWQIDSSSSMYLSSTENWSSREQPSNLVTSSQNWNAFQGDSVAANMVATAGLQTTLDVTRDILSNTSSAGTLTHSMPVQPWSAFPTDSSAANPVSVNQIPVVQAPSQSASAIRFSATADSVSTIAASTRLTRSELPEDLFAGGPQTNLQFSEFPARSYYIQTPGMDLVGGSYSRFQPPQSINPFDLPGDNSIGPAVAEFPSMNSVQTALPNLNMDGHQWNPANSIAPAQLHAPTAAVPTANRHFVNQQLPSSSFPTMQPETALSGSLSASMQNPQLFTFPNPTMNYFSEGKVPNYGVQGGTFTSMQNSEPLIFTNASVGSFGGAATFSAVQEPPFQNLTGLPGGYVNRTPGTDSSLSLHGAQQTATFGNTTVSDTMLHAQFLPQSSLGSVGNPFG